MGWRVVYIRKDTGARRVLADDIPDKVEADFIRYLEWNDEPAPDKDDYAEWIVEADDRAEREHFSEGE